MINKRNSPAARALQRNINSLQRDSRDLGWRGGSGSKTLAPMLAVISRLDDSEAPCPHVFANDLFDSTSGPYWQRLNEQRLFLAFGKDAGGNATAVSGFKGCDLYLPFERASQINAQIQIDPRMPFGAAPFVAAPLVIMIYPITASWAIPAYVAGSNNMPRIAWNSQPVTTWSNNGYTVVNPVTGKIDNTLATIPAKRHVLVFGNTQPSGDIDFVDLNLISECNDDLWNNIPVTFAGAGTARRRVNQGSHFEPAPATGTYWRNDTAIYSMCIHVAIDPTTIATLGTIYGFALQVMTAYDYAQLTATGTDLSKMWLGIAGTTIPTVHTPAGVPPSLPPPLNSAIISYASGIYCEGIGGFSTAGVAYAAEMPYQIERTAVSGLVDITAGYDQPPLYVYCSTGYNDDEAIAPNPSGSGDYNNFYAELDL